MSKKFTDNNAVEKLIQKQKWGLLWQTSGKTSPSRAGGASCYLVQELHDPTFLTDRKTKT